MQPNSSNPHGGTQVPLKQILFESQSPMPSSTMPLQSLSRLSQVSGDGLMSGTQVTDPSSWHSVTPCAQTPYIPVWHGSPLPWQTTPSNRNTLSLKSPSSGQFGLAPAPSQSSQAT